MPLINYSSSMLPMEPRGGGTPLRQPNQQNELWDSTKCQVYSLYTDSHLPLPLSDRLLLCRPPEGGKLLGRVCRKGHIHALPVGVEVST